jgi:dephospho-CoA kinase
VLLVGLTGGIAAGKSTVSATLAELGAEIVDADLIARQVVMPGKRAWHKIREHFGPGVFGPDGQVDRRKLADVVFADKAKLTVLNEITHPDIFAQVAERLERSSDREVVVVLDAALLIETGLADRVDVVVVVDAGDEEEQVRRLVAKGLEERDARARLAAQLPAEQRRVRADLVIDNSGTFEELTARVEEVWGELQRRLRERHGPSPIIRLP